jgi:tRNA-2-methylthio-N6-dimethylallyladenosine synthase
MNRRYTRERYLEKVVSLRRACPDIAITSDFIVGFPGETEDDFRQTLDLVRLVRFDSVFAFKYSDRPNTPAVAFTDKLTEAEKTDRLKQLFELQAEISLEKSQELVGSRETVLVEGESRRQEESDSQISEKCVQWTGRTSSNRIVNFSFDEDPTCFTGGLVGALVDVHIRKALAHSLWGSPIDGSLRSTGLKGASNYAA